MVVAYFAICKFLVGLHLATGVIGKISCFGVRGAGVVCIIIYGDTD
jgi:hypothetical protein